MRTEFCRVNTKDGLRLDGLLFEPEGEARGRFFCGFLWLDRIL